MQVYWAEIWHSKHHPPGPPRADLSFETFEDGALVVDDAGKILAVGERDTLCPAYPKAVVHDYRGKLILPGFVDAHLHFPQLDMIGRTGETLLTWLKRFTFPEEARLSSLETAAPLVDPFFDTLLAHGTTTSCLFASHSRDVTAAIFDAADRKGVRAIIGKTGMNRDVPEPLATSVNEEVESNLALLRYGHERDQRLFLALTPRFALSCTDDFLEALGQLRKENPGLYVQTHFSENHDEIAQTKRLFPGARDYLDVYDRYSLLGPRTILAHGLHASARERARASERDVAICHCPTSNLFLGSGLFPLDEWNEAHVKLALGTDIGGGTSASMWVTMGEAYKVQKLRRQYVPPSYLFYLATLGGARALSFHGVGNFESPAEADFQVLDPKRKPTLARRWSELSPLDRLSALLFSADDRLVERVFVRGREVFTA